MINYNCSFVDEPLRPALEKESAANRFSDKKLGYRSIKNATVLPCKLVKWAYGGGVVSDDRYEDDSACYTYVRNFGFAYVYDKTKTDYINETVVYVGMFAKIWGHCITDNLSLLWFLKSEYYEKYKNCKLIYIAPDGPLSENFIKLLALIGVDADKFVRITKPTVFAEVILPEKCFFTEGEGEFSHADMRFTQEYRNLIKEITDSVPAETNDKYDKVYFSRSRFSKDDVGEKKIEKYLKKHGYTVVYPEKYTLEQQLSILKRCNHFAATEGSISHNSVFLKPNTEVLLLLRASYITPHSFTLNAVNNLNATFISVNLSILAHDVCLNSGPNFYYVSDYLLRYFGDEALEETSKYWMENLGDFKKYLKKYKTFDNMDHRVSVPYYYSKVGACLQKYYYYQKRIFPYCLLYPYCLILLRPFVKKLLGRK